MIKMHRPLFVVLLSFFPWTSPIHASSLFASIQRLPISNNHHNNEDYNNNDKNTSMLDSRDLTTEENVDEALFYGDGTMSFGKCLALSVYNPSYYGKGGYYLEASVALLYYGYRGNKRDKTYVIDLNTYMEESGGGGTGCVAIDEDDYVMDYLLNNGDNNNNNNNNKNYNNNYQNDIRQWYIGFRCSSDGDGIQIDFFVDEACSVFTSYMKTDYLNAASYLKDKNSNNNVNGDGNNQDDDAEDADAEDDGDYYDDAYAAAAAAQHQQRESAYDTMEYAVAVAQSQIQKGVYCHDSYTCQSIMSQAYDLNTCQVADYMIEYKNQYGNNDQNNQYDENNNDNNDDEDDQNNNNYNGNYNNNAAQKQSSSSSSSSAKQTILTQSDLSDLDTICQAVQNVFHISTDGRKRRNWYDVNAYDNTKHKYTKPAGGVFKVQTVAALFLIVVSVACTIALIVKRHNSKKDEEDLLSFTSDQSSMF